VQDHFSAILNTDTYSTKSKKVTCKDSQIVEQELAEQVGGYLSKINLTEGECKLALQYVRNSKLINDSDSNASQWLELAEEFFTNAMTLVETFQEADTVKKKRILM
jgi:hypothetical protein